MKRAFIAETVLHHAQYGYCTALEAIIKLPVSVVPITSIIFGARQKKESRVCQAGENDILMMDTAARIGIPGFKIGNTTENIVQKLTCSLMALKLVTFHL